MSYLEIQGLTKKYGNQIALKNINLKIEKVKQLIQLRQYTFSEIGHLLDYSSVNHLSRQFKEITGESMTEYKNAELANRRPYDEIS